MLTEIVQLLPALMLALIKLTLPAPAVAVNVPPQLLLALEGLATTIAPGEVGNVSVNVTLLMALFGFGLVIVNVNMDMSPAKIGLARKRLPICGGATTVRVAAAAPPLPVLAPV